MQEVGEGKLKTAQVTNMKTSQEFTIFHNFKYINSADKENGKMKFSSEVDENKIIKELVDSGAIEIQKLFEVIPSDDKNNSRKVKLKRPQDYEEPESESSEAFNEEEKIKNDMKSSSSDEENKQNQTQNNINNYNNKDTNNSSNNYDTTNGKLLGSKRYSSKDRKDPKDYGDSRRKKKKYT